jgi:hemoglobin-like flavoprotein
MTPEQIALVRSSFALVDPIQEQAAVLFYRRLFWLDPRIAGLFAGTDMDRQRKVLMQTLKVVVAGLDRLDQIGPAVAVLGERHAGYGVRAEDYDTVGAALLWTLERGLGTAFTAEVGDAWAAAFGLLAGTMIGAAERASAASSKTTAGMEAGRAA